MRAEMDEGPLVLTDCHKDFGFSTERVAHCWSVLSRGTASSALCLKAHAGCCADRCGARNGGREAGQKAKQEQMAQERVTGRGGHGFWVCL
jgi:hypothetical protein